MFQMLIFTREILYTVLCFFFNYYYKRSVFKNYYVVLVIIIFLEILLIICFLKKIKFFFDYQDFDLKIIYLNRYILTLVGFHG